MAHTKVILTEELGKLGHAGEVVNVKPGFARNYLIPQGKAIPATAARVRELEHHRRIVAEKVARELKDLQAVKSQLDGLVLETEAQAGEEGKLFGSVTTAKIAELLAARGYAIDRRRIALPEPIKELGEHEVPVRLHRELEARIRVHVKASE